MRDPGFRFAPSGLPSHLTRVRPYGSERGQLEAAKRTIEQTRREAAELAEQIRASKETIAQSKNLLARLKEG